MPNHTRLNLKEVKDSAPGFGLAPNVEARFAGESLKLQNSAVSLIRFGPNFRAPFGHKHKTQEELYVVVDGSGRVKVDDEILDLKRWDALRVPKDSMRCFEGGPQGIQLLAIGAPRTGPGDAEMVQDWWKD